MGRIHWVEFHDQSWCPRSIRDAATDYLQFTATVGDQYRNIVPLLRTALAHSSVRRIVDLCSGGGGPWLKLHDDLAEAGEAPIPILLTDRHPNASAMAYARELSGGAVEGVPEPVDALSVPEHYAGLRTMFASFHHFRPDEARAILRDAVHNGQAIGVFEPVAREAVSIIAILFAPIIALVLMPFIRPFRLSRLFWTYVIPVVPIVIGHDGVVSCLRVYAPEELRALVHGLGEEGHAYHWEIGRAKNPAVPVELTYCVGYPAAVRSERG